MSIIKTYFWIRLSARHLTKKEKRNIFVKKKLLTQVMKWDLEGAGWIFSLKFFATGTKEDQRDVCRSLKWKITECIKTFCLPKLVRLMGDHFRRQRMKEKRG